MKSSLTLCVIGLIFALFACASPARLTPSDPITFITTFGGEARDRGINLIQTGDGGYAFVGYTSSPPAADEDVYLVRTDGRGKALWTRTYGGDGKDNGWAVVQTDDGGFLIVGFTDSSGAGEMDIYLIRTDGKGKLLWERTYGGPGSEFGWAIAPTTNGGYVLAGQTDSFGAGDRDGYIVKVDAGGEELWSHTFGGPEEDRLYSIDRTAEAGFILTGTTKSYGAGGRDSWLVKTNATGELEWTKVFGEEHDDVGHSVRTTTDTGFIITGYTRSFGARDYDSWLVKTDSKGDTQWQTLYGGLSDDRTIYGEQIDTGGFISIGYTKGFGAIGWDLFLVRTDFVGEVVWSKTFGGSGEDTGYTVMQTSDKGYALTGETTSFGAGGGDMYVIKVDPFGETR